MYERPRLYKKQMDAMFCDEQWAIIEASSKAGKTTVALAWLVERAIFGKQNANHWWVAPIRPQSEMAFVRLCRALPEHFYTLNLTKLTITFRHNGATIWFKSAERPDGLYGEDVWSCIVDEASRCKDATESAVTSVLTATDGLLRLIGNVRGKRNWAYKMARRAEAQTKARERGEAVDPDEPSMRFTKLTAWDAVAAGVLKKRVILERKSMLSPAVFAELYLAEAADDGSNPFGMEAIKAITRSDHSDGRRAMSNGEPVAWGWDLARGLKRDATEDFMMELAKKAGKQADGREDRDWTVGVALDADGHVCRYIRFQKPWPEAKATILRETGSVPALVDSTGVGDPVLADLQRGDTRLGEFVGGFNFQGYTFTGPSKQALMEELSIGINTAAHAISNGMEPNLGIPDDKHALIAPELEAFEYRFGKRNTLYSAPDGYHDDCVCALALAWHMYNDPSRSWTPLIGRAA